MHLDRERMRRIRPRITIAIRERPHHPGRRPAQQESLGGEGILRSHAIPCGWIFSPRSLLESLRPTAQSK